MECGFPDTVVASFPFAQQEEEFLSNGHELKTPLRSMKRQNRVVRPQQSYRASLFVGKPASGRRQLTDDAEQFVNLKEWKVVYSTTSGCFFRYAFSLRFLLLA